MALARRGVDAFSVDFQDLERENGYSWTAIVMVGLLSGENDVGGVLARLMFGDTVAERWQVDPGEHCFALPEHDGGQGEMQLVDQPGAKILTHGVDATADLHVATIGGELRLFQGRLDAVGQEDEGGAAFHLNRIAPMMRQHESRRVIGRIGAPPALPVLVRPGAANRPEHIAAEDEGAEPIHRTMGVGLIDAVRAALLTDHCPEHARTEHPLVQFLPALAERIFKTLLRPSSETVKRDRKACNAHSRHNARPFASTFVVPCAGQLLVKRWIRLVSRFAEALVVRTPFA